MAGNNSEKTMTFPLKFYQHQCDYAIQRGTKKITLTKKEAIGLSRHILSLLGERRHKRLRPKLPDTITLSSPRVVKLYFYLKENCRKPNGYWADERYSAMHISEILGVHRNNLYRLLAVLCDHGCVKWKRGKAIGMEKVGRLYYWIKPCDEIELTSSHSGGEA